MDFQPADRIKQLPPYLFMRLNEVRDAKIAEGVDVISLGIGDPDLPTPPAIVERLAEAGRDSSNHRYCDDGLPAFRQAIVDWYRRRFGVELDPATEIVPLIGSKEGIAHLPVALINPGDYTLVPDPSYPVYAIGTELVGGQVHYLPLTPENHWLPDLDAIPQEITAKAKLLWLCYPNNPTAAVADLDFFARAVDFGRHHDIIVCQDAAYSEVTYDGHRAPSILEVPGALDCVVEFHSLSKTYNMTGWRIGWAAGAPPVIEALTRLKSNMDSGIFAAVQEAGIAALNMPPAWIDERNAIYQRRRDLVIDTLREMNLEPEVPPASLYVWSPVPDGYDSSSFAARVIEEAGVIVTPGLGFGPGGDGYFRISLTISDERLKEALERLAALSF
jgi:LL-diaminopimelate aminotransferase